LQQALSVVDGLKERHGREDGGALEVVQTFDMKVRFAIHMRHTHAPYTCV